MTQYIIKKLSELNSENSDFRVVGFSCEALPNQSTVLEWKLPQERWISGGTFFALNNQYGDTASMFVVMKYEGEEDISDVFVESIVLPGTYYFELKIEVPYVSLVQKDFYIRIVYNNTSETNSVKVGMNLTTHIPTDAE